MKPICPHAVYCEECDPCRLGKAGIMVYRCPYEDEPKGKNENKSA
jgi:hypothetical protein